VSATTETAVLVDLQNAATETAWIFGAASGWQRAFRPIGDVSNRAGRVWCKAEHRLGVELDKLPKATGTAGKGRPKIGGTKSEPPKDTPTLRSNIHTRIRVHV